MKRFIPITSIVVSTWMAACSGGTDGRGADEVDIVGDNLGSVKSGEQQTNLSGSSRTQLRFSIDVSVGATNLRFVLSGGTGNADLYVRFGTPPTRSTFDFISANAGNDETIAPNVATAGTWFFMVRGRSAFSGANVVATFDPPSDVADAGSPVADAGTPPPPDAAPPPTGPDCQNPASWPADWVAFEDQVFVKVNERRAAGKACDGSNITPPPPLKLDEHLRQAARCHSFDMATRNYFDHTSAPPDGRSPWDRIKDAGYTAFGNAENIAAGQTTAEDVMVSWMNSPGHCNNIMSTGSNEIGIGFAFKQNSDWQRYWTQDFGQR